MWNNGKCIGKWLAEESVFFCFLFFFPQEDSLEVLKSRQGAHVCGKLEITSHIINQELWAECLGLSEPHL